MSMQPAGSHGTQVEQSRAVAEVFAAAELATRFPRNEQHAEVAMLRACNRTSLAERAEYALPRGREKSVVGPSVHLARELARIWGNITHGVVEISRNPDAGQSELMAYAWDVESNTRSARTFIVPHTRDKATWDKTGGKPRRTGTTSELIETQQDITNQNNSVAARQLRETIFSVLPTWFCEDAITACRATLASNDGGPRSATMINGPAPAAGAFPNRVDAAVRTFADHGITVVQLEQWSELPLSRWTEDTLGNVRVLYRSLQNGDISVGEAFPTEPLQPDDVPGPATSDSYLAAAAIGEQLSRASQTAADMLGQMQRPEPTEAELAELADREAGIQ